MYKVRNKLKCKIYLDFLFYICYLSKYENINRPGILELFFVDFENSFKCNLCGNWYSDIKSFEDEFHEEAFKIKSPFEKAK